MLTLTWPPDTGTEVIEKPPDDVNDHDELDFCNKIQVTCSGSLPTEQLLQLYFENAKRSGGGDIDKLTISGEVATVVFRNKSGE